MPAKACRWRRSPAGWSPSCSPASRRASTWARSAPTGFGRCFRPCDADARRHAPGSVGPVKAPIRLGLQIPNFNFPGVTPDTLFERLAEIATTAESVGFDSLFVMDHLHQIPGVGPQTDWMLEGNATLAALAARTERLHLGL